MVVPLLFGLFWGAPLVAKEFEDGTHNLAWTQGVSRRHWLRANVTWSLLAAAVWGAALAALVSWWRTPENALDSRFDAFDVQGIVPVAYAVFAVALGIAVGSLFRRVLPSLAVTLAPLRRHPGRIGVLPAPALHGARDRSFPTVEFGRAHPARGSCRAAWWTRRAPASATGFAMRGPPDRRAMQNSGGRSTPSASACRSHGFHQLVTYQPDSRFWAFQGMEAGIFLVLALASGGLRLVVGAVARRLSARRRRRAKSASRVPTRGTLCFTPAGRGPFSSRCSRLQRT